MPSPDLPHTYHLRLKLADYEEKLSGLDTSLLAAMGEADSPNQVWAREKLRAARDLAEVDKIPVDLLVWGKGPPPHLAGTKIGGIPAWPAGRPLPHRERDDWESPDPLSFFAQVNFADSLDLLPELPGQILSIWGTEDFPYGDSVQTFWLDPEDLELAVGYDPEFTWDFMPPLPYFAALHRSWDPIRRQQILDETAEAEDVPPDSCATSWMASKIGGQATRIQNEAGVEEGRLFLQLKSIEPATDYPHAWVSEPEVLKITGARNPLQSDREGLNLADGGVFYFFITPWGSVETVFEFH